MDLEGISTGVKKDQNSRGVLNNQKDKSSPPEDLNNHHKPNFLTISEKFVELPISDIQPFTEIPDYKTPTRSFCPIVVQTQNQSFCIDGFEKIEAALNDKQTSIECFVYLVADFSQIDLCLRKAAIRSLPKAGICSYGEIIRNVRLLYRMLKNTDENPIVYSHGGARRGHNYSDDSPENNIRILLSERLGKDIKKINSLINYGDKLNDATLNQLAENKTSRRFFEAAQKNKREKIKRLQDDGVQDDDLINIISQDVLSWHEEFISNDGIIETIWDKPQSQVSQKPPENNSPPKKTTQNPPKNHEHWNGNDTFKEENMPTSESVYNAIGIIGNNLVAVTNDKPESMSALEKQIQSSMQDLSEIYEAICYLKNGEQIVNREEVA